MPNKLERLKSAQSVNDLAILLGFKAKNLTYIVYQIPGNVKYTSFQIPKKNGAPREIQAPIDKLKLLQSRLSDLLYDCIEENSPKNSTRKQLSHGFLRGLSIVTNAQKHIRQRYVFNVDIQDFFQNINFGRVRGYFIKNRMFELSPKIATVIAQIACYKNGLPQGSPCSPIISNLIAQTLDSYLVQLAKKHNCLYSRYADDITFSSKSNIFPKEVAKEKNKYLAILRKVFLNKSDKHNWDIGPELAAQITRSGFTVNPNKTRMQLYDSRQVTTGLIVNKKVNVKSEYYKTVRSQCHELFKKGSFYHKSDASENEDQTDRENGTLDQLEGKLNFIFQIKDPKRPQRRIHNDKNGNPFSNEYIKEHGPFYERKNNRRKNPRGITAIYQRFLHFKYLYFLKKPLIICEGKTDNIYLNCAINQQAKHHPALATTNKNGTELHIDIFNNHGRVKEIWDLGMGAPFLAKLIFNYEKSLAPFKCGGLVSPVIIIVDNDNGPRGKCGVYKSIEDYGKQNVDGTAPYYHVTKNLYVVPLPQVTPGINIDFEDLFTKTTLSIKNNNKTFAKKVTNDKTEYGKKIFASHIVKPNQETINFSGFDPLLTVISDVISHYNTIKP